MFPRFCCWLLVLLALPAGLASGQNSAQADPSENQKKRWMALYAQEAAKYEMFRRGTNVDKLEFVPTPILTFTNPVRGRDQHGAAFVWTYDGRPEVVGAIWSVITPEDSSKRHTSHELHSLSLVSIDSKHEPRSARRGPVPNWTANKPGIVPKPIAAAKKPVKQASLRLTQMRRLARRFEAKIPPGAIDGEGALRLLSQPLYRYQSNRQQVIDGAIFAFVMGTDPELILLIEAVESPSGPTWQFAAAPFTNLPMQLEYQGTEVWDCPPAKPYVGNLPHFMYWGVSIHEREIE